MVLATLLFLLRAAVRNRSAAKSDPMGLVVRKSKGESNVPSGARTRNAGKAPLRFGAAG